VTVAGRRDPITFLAKANVEGPPTATTTTTNKVAVPR
jgi:hypothetical protein